MSLKNVNHQKRSFTWYMEKPSAKDYFLTVFIFAVCTLIGLLFQKLNFTDTNIVTIYILGVLLTSIVTDGYLCSVAGSFLSVFLFCFFLTEPRMSFKTYAVGYPVTFFIMLISSVLTGALAAKLKTHAKLSTQLAFRAQVLFDTDRLLQKAKSETEILGVTCTQLIRLLNRSITAYVVENGTLSEAKLFSGEKESTEAEPVGWNSFMSGDGSLAGFTKSVHMEKSNVTRPGTNGNVSVRIWTKGVIGSIVANGNLTCGRINSGSMEALSQENHNRTVVGDSEFSQPLHGSRPDSLTVWVNYTYLGDSVMNARVSAIIHDTYDCADPSSPADSVHIVAKAQLNYKAVDPVNGGWQRLSIPFDYELKDYEEFYEKMNNSDYWKDSLKVDHFVKPTSADYMLVTFATNSTPAVGKEGDQVLIDDMLLIYKPTLEFSKTDKGTYYPGSRIVADYILTGTMSPSNVEQDHNVVSLELSDAKGSFEKPTVLTQIATDKGGTLTATLSEELPLGDYKVRIVTTNYPMVSNELAVSVVAVPAIKAIEATEVKDDSFVANWEAPAEAEVTDYLLTVKEGDTVLEGYNEKSTGKVTSYKVEGLTGDVNYTYTVKAVFGAVVSESSNEIAVTTRPVGIEKVTVEGNVTVYPNPVVNTLYINGVTENSAYSIYNQSGSMVASGSLTVNRVDVSALNSGVYFIETEAGKAKFIKK